MISFRTRGEYGLVMDGPSLTILLGNSNVTERLVRISAAASAVIACRITPRQKSALVSLIKMNLSPTPMCLSVGDGANDVAMIRTAHVGVGITGNEGRQAVAASDYAIGQFRFLVNLLLCHGRNNYNRVSLVILFSFFKNICLLVPVFYYNFTNGYSGTMIYESYLMMTFNLFWTSVPVCIVGIFDRDVPDLANMHVPILYQQGQLQKKFSAVIFVRWSVEGVLLGTAMFWFHYYAFHSGALHPDGLNLDWIAFGSACYHSVIWCVNLKLAIVMLEKNRLFVLNAILSCLLLVPYIFLFDVFLHKLTPRHRQTYVIQGTTIYIWSSLRMWMLNILLSSVYFVVSYFGSIVLRDVLYQSPVNKLVSFVVRNLKIETRPDKLEERGEKTAKISNVAEQKMRSVSNPTSSIVSAGGGPSRDAGRPKETTQKDINVFWDFWDVLMEFHDRHNFQLRAKAYVLKKMLVAGNSNGGATDEAGGESKLPKLGSIMQLGNMANKVFAVSLSKGSRAGIWHFTFLISEFSQIFAVYAAVSFESHVDGAVDSLTYAWIV